MPSDSLSPEAVVELAGELIRIPSVNPSIAPEEAHGESAAAGFASAWLTRRGVKAWLEEATPGRPNAVAEVVGEPGPTLVLCAHLDTVGTAGMTIPPFEPTLREGMLFGRGSYDMKGSAAAIMLAAAELNREPFRGRLLLALVADEEYASIGADDFVRRHAADACILTESSAHDLILAHKGFVWAEVVTRGRAAHGSRWDLGVSAVARMGRVIAALDRFDHETLRARVHPLVGPASMHCAMVQGGVGLTTYAPECRLKIERRTLPGETPQQVLEEIAAVVRQAGEEAEILPLFERPPLTADSESPIARCVRAGAMEVTGKAPAETGVAYWMDAAVFAGAGIPAVNYGPDGAGAHEAVEWVDVASLVTCARVYVECARSLWQHMDGVTGAER